MSYTVTISGTSLPSEGQTQEQSDAQVVAKAKAFAQTLPAVSAAFIQTMTGGMEDLNPPAPIPEMTASDTSQEAVSG